MFTNAVEYSGNVNAQVMQNVIADDRLVLDRLVITTQPHGL